MESNVLHHFCRQWSAKLNNLDTVYFLYIFQQSFFQGCFFFFHEVFHLLLQTCVFVNVFTDSDTQIRSIVEESFQVIEGVLNSVQHFFYPCSCVSLDTADTGSNGTFGDDFHHTNVSCSSYVCTSTEFDGRSKLYHTHSVAVLLAEESDSTQLFRFFDRNIAVFLQRNVGTYLGVDNVLYFADFFIGHFLEMREVET